MSVFDFRAFRRIPGMDLAVLHFRAGSSATTEDGWLKPGYYWDWDAHWVLP